MNEKKVFIFHYRVGGTDGVSLEISKRVKLLKNLGYKSILIAGGRSKGADFIIPLLEFDLPEINIIKKNVFFKLEDFRSCEELFNYIRDIQSKIYREIESLYLKIKPEIFILHNIFSHGRHIAVAKPFYDIIEKYKINTISFDHDFYWDREIYLKPVCKWVNDYLQTYVPPSVNLPGSKYIKHIVINSFNKENLLKEKNIDSMILPDLFEFDDFKEKIDVSDKFYQQFNIRKNDLIFLQATRIVERKAIEIAIDFIDFFYSNGYFEKLKRKKIYNGKKIDNNSRLVFILAGYAEKDSLSYLEKLKVKSKKIENSSDKQVLIKFIGDNIKANRNENDDGHFTLWDCYHVADFVTYPSINEGWGNQFLEAIWERKPIIVFEYPVFEKDIKNQGYFFISFGNRYTVSKDGFISLGKDREIIYKNVSDKVLDSLLNWETIIKLENNFNIAMKNNSIKAQEKLFKKLLENY